VLQAGGSDLHLSSGSPPQLRVDGKLNPMDVPRSHTGGHQAAGLQRDDDTQKHKFEEKWEIDLFFRHSKTCAVPCQRVHTNAAPSGAVFRLIPFEIRGFDALGLPPW